MNRMAADKEAGEQQQQPKQQQKQLQGKPAHKKA
mgnify:CR=1 FL=1